MALYLHTNLMAKSGTWPSVALMKHLAVLVKPSYWVDLYDGDLAQDRLVH